MMIIEMIIPELYFVINACRLHTFYPLKKGFIFARNSGTLYFVTKLYMLAGNGHGNIFPYK